MCTYLTKIISQHLNLNFTYHKLILKTIILYYFEFTFRTKKSVREEYIESKRMQQAVTSSSQITLPITLNRILIQQRFNSLFRTFNDYLHELNILNKLDLKNSKLIKIRNKLSSKIESLENTAKLNLNPNLILPIENILVDLIASSKQAKLNNEQFVIDALIEPIFDKDKYKLSPTFFENRYGFREEELLKSTFRDSKKSNLFKNNYNGSRFLNHQQQRGFRTKNQRKADEEDGNSIKNIFSSMRSTQQDQKTNSEIEKVLSSLLKNSKTNTASSKAIGSIFGDNKSTSSVSGSKSPMDLDDKIKVAFAEGFLYRQSKEDKRKLPTPIRFLSFLLFVLFIFLLTSSVSVSVPTTGNGKNGGGGINIRALTGNVNYEVNPETVNVKFDDVKGLPEAKKELTEIVDFLKDPEKYTKLGARLPKGVLLVGPPGCGKTLLAKSVAGEAGVPFFQASGSDFDEMFVGTGSKRVRQLFAAARARAPCVIFIDEIDSVGSTRTNSMIHPHANQTINQLLAEMDGFQKNEGVIVLGATNRRETLDSALMRPGRFDLEVRIDKPDLKARIEMLEYYLEKVAKDKDVDVRYLARQLTGLGGSSIENVVNQAALRAVVNNSNTVKMEHLEWALDRALMGYGKSRLADEECNRNTAYHEAGHVLVAYFTKDSDSLHKVTILPRASSLGHTAFVPENDVYSKTKSQLLAQMDVSMGGRVAEELAFGVDKITTGASADFRAATNVATQMVKTLGMNDRVGVRVFEGEKDEHISPQTKELLDQEIKKLLQESYDRAKTILKAHSYELKLIAETLMVHETLDVDQIKSLIENHKL